MIEIKKEQKSYRDYVCNHIFEMTDMMSNRKSNLVDLYIYIVCVKSIDE